VQTWIKKTLSNTTYPAFMSTKKQKFILDKKMAVEIGGKVNYFF
jgi:hypothetical protein